MGSLREKTGYNCSSIGAADAFCCRCWIVLLTMSSLPRGNAIRELCQVKLVRVIGGLTDDGHFIASLPH